jgi:hypothetical protein
MIKSGGRWRLRFGLLSLLVVSISLTAWVGSSAAATTTSFTYTGAEQTYSVPAGAVGVTITAVGAPGGHGAFSSGVAGGYGASVTATVPLPAGTTTLYVEVGGIGASPASCGSAVFAFNGGGGSSCGGGGGGASDVRLDSATTALTTTDSRLVVAGGGGGGATGDQCGGPGGAAGNTGVTGAGNGGDGNDTNAPPDCTAAAGGDAGLAGNQGGIGGLNSFEYAFIGVRAGGGSLGQGGAASNQGAGGGGGYWGGGGGGAGFVGGGGGGGSSFWVAGATGTSMSEDTTGTTSVSITPVFPPVTPASVCNQTLQYADGSAKYLALSQKQKTAFDKTITALCAADLNPITPGINPTKKKALIAAYKVGVNLLATGGWLTQSPQATQLATLADQL